MPAGFVSLRDDRVSASRPRGARLGQGRRGGEPRDAALLQTLDERWREYPHDRRDDGWRRGDEGVALRG